MGKLLPPHSLDGLRPKRSAYSGEFQRQVLSHQDREQLSSSQVAAFYNIRNPNQAVVWRRNLDQHGRQAPRNSKQGRPPMNPERRIKLELNGLSPVGYRLKGFA